MLLTYIYTNIIAYKIYVLVNLFNVLYRVTSKYIKQNNVQVILNPAPVQLISEFILRLVDIIILNEVEAGEFTDIQIRTIEDAEKTACIL